MGVVVRGVKSISEIPKEHQERYMEILCGLVEINPTLLLKYGFPLIDADEQTRIVALSLLKDEIEEEATRKTAFKC